MKLDRLRIQDKPRLMIIPMIDIIFFLLVFFMISTLNMVEQKTVPLQLPQAKSIQVSTEEAITLSITVNQQLYWNDQAIERSQLPGHLAQQLAIKPDTRFILRGDKNVSYGEILQLFDELKAQGISKLALAAEGQK